MNHLTRRCLLRQIACQPGRREISRNLPADLAEKGTVMEIDAGRFQIVDIQLPAIPDKYENPVLLRIGA